jgi:hypothetical protein
VGGPGVTVAAGVPATPVGIQRPAESEIRDIDPIQQSLAEYFLYFGFGHRFIEKFI